jgi:hypothetical protein
LHFWSAWPVREIPTESTSTELAVFSPVVDHPNPRCRIHPISSARTTQKGGPLTSSADPSLELSSSMMTSPPRACAICSCTYFNRSRRSPGYIHQRKPLARAVARTPSPNKVMGSPYALNRSLTFLSSVGTAIFRSLFFRSKSSRTAAFSLRSRSSSEPPRA